MRTLLIPAPLNEGPVEVTGDEARHGRTVLRLRAGDQLYLADGAGCRGQAVVKSVERHSLQCVVTKVVTLPHSAAEQIHVVVAPPKGNRFDDMVRSLTELGVGQISPLACERASRMPTLERAQRVAAEACKQSRRAWMPIIGPVLDIAACTTSEKALMVLDPQGKSPVVGEPKEVMLIIGPEGGLTDQETADLQAAQAGMMSIAPHILRIETAAVVATGLFVSAWTT